MNKTGYLKGSAASEVNDVLQEHQGHTLYACEESGVNEEGEPYVESFLWLRCLDCAQAILELDE